MLARLAPISEPELVLTTRPLDVVIEEQEPSQKLPCRRSPARLHRGHGMARRRRQVATAQRFLRGDDQSGRLHAHRLSATGLRFSAQGSTAASGSCDAGLVADWGIGHYERTAEVLLPAARVLVDAASLRTGERVLDLGCGTGNVALLAAAAGAAVTAVDPSRRLVGVASATARRDGLEITCDVGDAASIPAPDATFDCVLSNFALIFAPDPDAALAELVRVGNAEGRIALTAWLPGGALDAFASTAEQLVRAAVGAPPAAPAFPWHDESSLRALFARYGMNVEVAGPHELVIRASSPEEFLEAEMSNHPLAVAGNDVFRQRGVSEEAHERLLGVLRDQNEDQDVFRSTSRYVVILARRA